MNNCTVLSTNVLLTITSHVMIVLLFSETAGTSNRDNLCLCPGEPGSSITVLFTAVTIQNIDLPYALQVNSATPPSGTGEGFSSATLLDVTTI